MESDELQAVLKHDAQLAPRAFADRRRHRITVENAEHERDQRLALPEFFASGKRPQYALDHLGHHRKADWISPPARQVAGRLKFRLLEQDLGVVAGSRP